MAVPKTEDLGGAGDTEAVALRTPPATAAEKAIARLGLGVLSGSLPASDSRRPGRRGSRYAGRDGRAGNDRSRRYAAGS